MELTTTLNKIKNCISCREGWETTLRYLGKTSADDEPLPLLTVLESNGIKVAILGLCTLDDKYDNAVRLFTCFCARYCLDIFEKEYPGDMRPRLAIETADLYAMGRVTKEELDAALSAVEAAAAVAARDSRADALAVTLAAVEAADTAVALSAAEAAAWNARDAVCGTIRNATWNCFADEFKRLCLLEGEYGEVVRKEGD